MATQYHIEIVDESNRYFRAKHQNLLNKITENWRNRIFARGVT